MNVQALKGDGKKWYAKPWVWIVIVVILIVSAAASSEENNQRQNTVPNVTDGNKQVQTTVDNDKNANDSFDQRALTVCGAIQSAYKKIAQVDCQDSSTWEENNKRNPQQFPYEYRDIDVDFGGQISYTIKVISDKTRLDYFRNENQCSNLVSSQSGCATGDTGNDILFAVVLNDRKDDETANQLASELKTVLEKL